MRHGIVLAVWLAAISVAAPCDGTAQPIQSTSFGLVFRVSEKIGE
jgi:hypothetical protein